MDGCMYLTCQWSTSTDNIALYCCKPWDRINFLLDYPEFLARAFLWWHLAVQRKAVVWGAFLMFLLWFVLSLLHFGHGIYCNLYDLEITETGLCEVFCTQDCIQATSGPCTRRATCTSRRAPGYRHGRNTLLLRQHLHFTLYTHSSSPVSFRRQTAKSYIIASSGVERKDHFDRHKRLLHFVLVTPSWLSLPSSEKEQVKSFSESPLKPTGS